MASVQACGSAEAYLAKHKSVLTEMCSLAQPQAPRKLRKTDAFTFGIIENNPGTNRPWDPPSQEYRIKLLTKHDWCGQIDMPYPASIAKGQYGRFSHIGERFDKAAVVYSDEHGAGWLLAWAFIKRSYDHYDDKVYVETGPIANYMAINWCEIMAKLDKSCNTSYCVDASNANEAFATVNNKGSLHASFTTPSKN